MGDLPLDGNSCPRLLPASSLGKPSSCPESVSDDGSVVVGSNMADMRKGKNVGYPLPLIEMQLALRFAALH